MIKNKCFFLMFWSIHSFFKLISFEKIFSRFFSERKKEQFSVYNFIFDFRLETGGIVTMIYVWTMCITLSLLVMLIFDVFLFEFIFYDANKILRIVFVILFFYVCFYIKRFVIYDEDKHKKIYERLPAGVKKKWGWITFLAIILVLCYDALCVWLITKLQH